MTVGEYRIGLSGSRNWTHGSLHFALRHTVHKVWNMGFTPVLIHGGCPTGADYMAHEFWTTWQWEQPVRPMPEVYEADWDKCGPGCPRGPHRVKRWLGDRHHPGTLDDWCPKAGPRRNKLMVDLGMDELLAFPMSMNNMRSGTWSCINYARAAHVPVVFPDRWR